MGTAEASQAHLGKKQLTTLHAIGQSLALGPIFSAALFIGFISAFAGYSTPVPDRVRNAAAYATRIEDAAPAAPVDLGL